MSPQLPARAALSIRGGKSACGMRAMLFDSRTICSVRKGSSPDSIAFFNHNSHSSSKGKEVLSDSWSVARSPRTSCRFRATPTLVSSPSLSSSSPSISSSGVAESSSKCPLCVARAVCGLSSGSIHSAISSKAVSWITTSESLSKRSFAHFVPSHLVRLAISELVRRRASNARNKRRCHCQRLSRIRWIRWV